MYFGRMHFGRMHFGHMHFRYNHWLTGILITCILADRHLANRHFGQQAFDRQAFDWQAFNWQVYCQNTIGWQMIEGIWLMGILANRYFLNGHLASRYLGWEAATLLRLIRRPADKSGSCTSNDQMPVGIKTIDQMPRSQRKAFVFSISRHNAV